MRIPASILSGLMILATSLPAMSAPTTAEDLYRQNCAKCHGADRLGRIGPALLPENLKRLKPKQARKVIRDGRAATQMPAFGDKLDDAQIASLVELIYQPLKEIPRWGLEEIRNSHVQYHAPGSLPDRPKFDADPDNLFIVVELGDHHASLLDGDRFEVIERFPTRFALHGGPKYSPDGRYVYFASRDGWISKYDIWNLSYVAEVRAGINTRNLAVSGDGKVVMVANYLPHNLVALDAETLQPIRVIPARDEKGRSSRVSAVYTAAPRDSFIVALKDIPEVWEISYLDPPPGNSNQQPHGNRKGVGKEDTGGRFPIRRIATKGFLDDFFMTQDYSQIAASSRDGKGEVIDLDLGRAVQAIDLPGMPHLSSAISWPWRDSSGREHIVMATPNLRKSQVSILDTEDWSLIRNISTDGPGFFMRSHENTPYAWTDVFFGPKRDEMHVIDKKTLKIVKTLVPEPGKTSAHVEFTKDGRYALVSIWDKDGAVVIYDARSLQEVKRLPMKKPSGKYNVHNKINRSAGTSH